MSKNWTRATVYTAPVGGYCIARVHNQEKNSNTIQIKNVFSTFSRNYMYKGSFDRNEMVGLGKIDSETEVQLEEGDDLYLLVLAQGSPGKVHLEFLSKLQESN
mmetsp:Transcript_10641/g.12115  ORF Transcript_10641/g.12115 Transcript_10641/m.12115 type:complete len:103 (+) Transcript_10641:278-586(+)